MNFFESGAALAADVGVPGSVLEQVHEEHYKAVKKPEKDPDGGSVLRIPPEIVGCSERADRLRR